MGLPLQRDGELLTKNRREELRPSLDGYRFHSSQRGEATMRLPGKFIQKLARIAVIAVLSWFPMSLAVGVRPAAAQVQFEFRTALEPYGSFQRVAHRGEVWVPN